MQRRRGTSFKPSGTASKQPGTSEFPEINSISEIAIT